MSTVGRARMSWPAAGLLLLAVLVSGVAAIRWAPVASAAASWWPGAGIAVVLLGRTSRRSWWVWVPAIVAVGLLANLLGGRPADLSVWYAVANAVEALVVAAYLLRDRDTLDELSTIEAFLRLLTGAVLGGLTIATLAATGAQVLGDGSFTQTWRVVAASHATAILVIVPLATAPRGRVWREAPWELTAQLAALVVATLVVFGPHQTLTLDFLPLPLLVWAALRFDVRVVAWEVAGFGVAVMVTSFQDWGTFGFDRSRGELTSTGLGSEVQAYVVAAALMSLPLAIATEQRRRSERLFRRNFTESVVGMLLIRGHDGEGLEVTDLNDAAARLLPADTLGRRLDQVLETTEPFDLVAARLVAGELDGWTAQTGVRGRPGTRVEVAVSLLTTDPVPTYAAQLLDVTAEVQARHRVEAAEKLTSATLDTTAAMILVADLHGEVLRVNGATLALTGFAEDELVGTEVWDLPFAPPGSSGYPAGLPDDAHAQVSRETDVVTRTGRRRRVLWKTGYVRDERDRPTHVVLTGTDLTAERAHAGLNRHLLEAAVTTALIGIDRRGLITVFNAGAVNLLGLDAQDTVGRPFVDLLDPEEVVRRCGGRTGEEAFAALVDGIELGGGTAERDWTWIGAEGRRHTVAMTLSVAADRIAAAAGYLCVGRDVAEARAGQEMLITALEKEREAVQRMREVDAAKNEFVSTVSHELRTPVTSIVGYTEVLEDGSVVAPAEEQRPLLESIARNGHRLIMLCDDLLTLAGLDTATTAWEHDPLDLRSVLPAAEDAVRAQLARRDLTLDLQAPDDPVLVAGDRVQLERALTNLLSNAVKFTDDGGRITVSLTVADREACLSVTDTGIGIPVEEQDRLFERFFRSSTAQQRAIQGTGLGLSIVGAIVAAHGGRIEVRSAHLEGTTVTIRLPLVRG
ncbi:ATP-binding protein [Nocardioides sp.]|uniref:ATP-binding protein n=1 Tax=Nocardioides sp. TaxID=35761 RepID=UPI0037833DC6